jgi:hypothetical protein
MVFENNHIYESGTMAKYKSVIVVYKSNLGKEKCCFVLISNIIQVWLTFEKTKLILVKID